MNKTKGLFFTASLVLALTLTQSCSGDDGGGGGGDPSSSSGGETQGGGDNFGLSKQVYLVGRSGNDYVKTGNSTDNSEIALRLRDGSTGKYDTLPAGNIQNGQLSLNLPENIDSKYYTRPCFGIEGECPYSIVPQDLNIIPIVSSFIVRSKSSCRFGLGVTKSGVVDRDYGGGFFYSSAPGTITGTEIRQGSDEEYGFSYDFNLSQGWNLVFAHDAGVTEYYSTSPLTETPLEWFLICN